MNLIIGLWLTPYLITNLGVENYGLYPLANSITSYLSLITLALNGAVGRYLAIEIQKRNFTDANKTFNTALFGSTLISIFTLPLIFLFINAVPQIFDIPAGQERNSQLLFFFIMVSFFVTTIESCFSVSTWAKNRFDLRNAIVIITNIVRVVSIIIMFTTIDPIIWFIGFSIFIASIFSLIGNIFLWKKLTPELVISFYNFDKARIRILSSMGIWILINQIGALLFLNMDIVIANIGLGAKIAGEYGTILIFSILIRGFASTISSVLTPIIIEKYAHGEIERIISLSFQAVKLLGIAVGVIVGLICGFSEPFLGLWLGKNFESLWLLLVIIVIHLPINLSVLPLFAIQVTLNRVKIPGLVTLAMGLLNLLLALFFIYVLNWGAYGIAGAAAIVLTLKNAIFTPIYGAKIQKLQWRTYIFAIFPGMVVAIITALISWWIASINFVNNWVQLILLGTIAVLLSLVIIQIFILNKNDKIFLQNFIPRK